MSHSSTTISGTATFLLLTLSSVACEDAGETADNGLGVVVEDSAGITIVENTRPAPDSRLPWAFGNQPSLSIGVVEGDEADQLFQIQDATRLSDGRIVIANGGSNELRVFNPDGSHSGTWGGRGEGPGEFSSGAPFAVAPWPGGLIAASNPASHRLSLFDMDGSHVRDVGFDITLSHVFDFFPDGRMLTNGALLLNRRNAGSSDLVRYDTEWAVLDTDGTLHASLGEFLETEEWVISFPDGSTGETPHPFRRGTLGAMWGNLVAIGVQDGYEIRAFAADGSLVRIVRRDGNARIPTRADLEEYFTRLNAQRNLPPEQLARTLSMFGDLPLVESYPAFEEVLADRVGFLWVREYRMFGEGDGVWTVFDPEGRVQGLAETPAGLNVFEIGEDYVLGSADDEMGVEFVEIWGLSRDAR